MARNLSAKKRREVKARKLLSHQQQLDGRLPVYEFKLIANPSGELVNEPTVYQAPLEPIAEGYLKDSQTARVMQHLELWGAEGARL